LIDFRNYIPGVVDAPVFRADETNRLSGRVYFAQLFAGPDETSLTPWGAAVMFGTGEMAGYWDADDPIRAVGTVEPGDRVVVQVRAWEFEGGCNYDGCAPPRLFGQSSLLSLIITDAPTPLVGLESFSLRAAPIRAIYAQGDEIVLRWSAGNGNTQYQVEMASGLAEPLEWIRVPAEPTLIHDDNWWDWILTSKITVPAAYYRIRLLDP
jgi:hypothetical protein